MSFNGTVTPAGPEDLDALAAVEAACFSRPWSRESLAAALADPHTLLLTARLDGAVAGYAGMQTVLDEGYIANVAVLPDHRRLPFLPWRCGCPTDRPSPCTKSGGSGRRAAAGGIMRPPGRTPSS